MLTKKQRKIVKITIPVVIILIIIAVLGFLYLTTDMFKSNESLFFKYLGKNSKNISDIQNMFENREFDSILNSKKYSDNIEISANYIENYETTSEKTDNIINKLKLNINSEIDAENNYKNYNIELSNQDEKSLKINLQENNEKYQIAFPELFAQAIEIDDINSLFEKYEIQNINLDDLQNVVNFDILEKLKFSDDEINSLKNKYIDFIELKTNKYKFSKKTDQKININEKEFRANEYTLTMTKEEFNNLYIDILNEIKNDETIINKINNLQEIFTLTLQNSRDIQLKDVFVDYIDEKIDNINKTNIGTEEVKIIVYESDGKTISTIIENTDYEIDFDNLRGEENFSEISIKNKNKDITKLSLSQNGDIKKYTLKNIKDENETIFEIEEKNNNTNNGCQKDTTIKYQYETNKIEIIINRKIDTLNDLELKEFSDNNIILDNLEKEQLNTIIKTVSEKTVNNINEITQNTNILEDIQKILINVGLVKENQQIISEGTSESEKNRFNSRFELLKGEDLTAEDLERIIDEIGDNINNLIVESNTTLKIEINELEHNEELVQKLKDFTEKNKNRKYNLDMEYDEITGLVKYIILTINEDKR